VESRIWNSSKRVALFCDGSGGIEGTTLIGMIPYNLNDFNLGIQAVLELYCGFKCWEKNIAINSTNFKPKAVVVHPHKVAIRSQACMRICMACIRIRESVS